MAFTPGSKLGPYEIVSVLGAGGMGEVFRAHDSRLGRDVAVKVLPDIFNNDSERLSRFEQEARAVAALNHPNIMSVFDIGEHNGTQYIVTELLEGETLRTKLNGGALPVRRVQEYALQIAQGLAAAHDKGIVHRDLKPENIFISKDGRAKILDFGLAKQNAMASMVTEGGATLTSAPTAMPQTTPGVMLGTIGYMSPEQVRGVVADHRSDIFSFGAVLHEMLSGERPFRRDTSAETMTAILKEDPPELLSSSSRIIPPGVDRIMRRCLEKDPDQRFQSAKDLAFALDAMSGASTSSLRASISAGTRKISVSMPTVISGASILLALIVWGGVALSRSNRASIPTFHQLTSSRGFIRTARFSPDGQTVVFGGAWNGEPLKLFFQRADANGYSPLAVPDADLLAVSATGELAIALNRKNIAGNSTTGTLARTSFTGGSAREVIENVQDADWSPNGSAIAVTHDVGTKYQLEYPIGKVLYETTGYISDIKFSHRGDKIAFMDHPIAQDDRGYISVIDLSGKKKVLTPEYSSERGLAWSPDDQELWFGAVDEESGNFNVLRGVTLSGKVRVILRAPSNLKLHDIARDGRVLLSTDSFQNNISFGDLSGGTDRDLTWFDLTWQQFLSNDGKWYIFSTQEAGASTDYSVYARKTDGTPAIRLGDGNSQGISPDNKWAVAGIASNNKTLSLLPLGTGEARKIKSEKVRFSFMPALWMPDNKHFLINGSEQDLGSRVYVMSLDGGEPKAISPENTLALLIAPDGKHFLSQNTQGKYFVNTVEEGAPREVTAIQTGERPIQWLQDGKNIVLRTSKEKSVETILLDVDTGNRKPWKKILPSNSVGLMESGHFQVTPDGSHYLLFHGYAYSTLFVVKGLK